MLYEILDEINILPEHAIMIGDTVYDLEMATNAGIPSIGVNYGAHSPKRLKKYQPLFCVDRIADIKMNLKQ
jgi:phosphoglycolate phosphatase